MIELVKAWAEIASPTYDVQGLERMRKELERSFSALGGEMRTIDLPAHTFVNLDGEEEVHEVGKALAIRKRPDAPIQVFLGGHFDTVYRTPFPVERIGDRLKGPGVTDMKGGIVVMLAVLENVERLGLNIGWEVLLTPDEEAGSPSSSMLFEEIAMRHDVGLLFESASVEGWLVSSRPASKVYTVVVKGKAAHAGKNPEEGRNAIVALSHLITRQKGMNVGEIRGGVAANVVPAHAACRINVRGEGEIVEVEEIEAEFDVKIAIYPSSIRPAKPFCKKTQKLFEALRDCGKELGAEINWKESGGVCDGNNLAAYGLPTIDALGALGGSIHTPEEFLLVESLVERAELTTLFLKKLVEGEIDVSRR